MENEKIERQVILGIKSIAEEFLDKPYYFQTEYDIQSRLYAKLIKNRDLDEPREADCGIGYGKRYHFKLYDYTNLVHTECKISEGDQTRTDLVILDPNRLNSHRIEPLMAVEISKNASLKHKNKKVSKLIKDYLKLGKLKRIRKILLSFNSFTKNENSFGNKKLKSKLKTKFDKIKEVKARLKSKQLCCLYVEIWTLRGRNKKNIRRTYVDEFGKISYFKKMHKNTLFGN